MNKIPFFVTTDLDKLLIDNSQTIDPNHLPGGRVLFGIRSSFSCGELSSMVDSSQLKEKGCLEEEK